MFWPLPVLHLFAFYFVVFWLWMSVSLNTSHWYYISSDTYCQKTLRSISTIRSRLWLQFTWSCEQLTYHSKRSALFPVTGKFLHFNHLLRWVMEQCSGVLWSNIAPGTSFSSRKTGRAALWSMLNDDVLTVNTAATAKGTNCDVTAAAGMMSSVTQKCGMVTIAVSNIFSVPSINLAHFVLSVSCSGPISLLLTHTVEHPVSLIGIYYMAIDFTLHYC